MGPDLRRINNVEREKGGKREWGGGGGMCCIKATGIRIIVVLSSETFQDFVKFSLSISLPRDSTATKKKIPTHCTESHWKTNLGYWRKKKVWTNGSLVCFYVRSYAVNQTTNFNFSKRKIVLQGWNNSITWHDTWIFKYLRVPSTAPPVSEAEPSLKSTRQVNVVS